MLIGYMRVSKTDGSQATDLQRNALTAAGVAPAHLYEDREAQAFNFFTIYLTLVTII